MPLERGEKEAVMREAHLFVRHGRQCRRHADERGSAAALTTVFEESMPVAEPWRRRAQADGGTRVA